MWGMVASFNDEKGYGEIVADDNRSYFFHCTQLADGTRTIPVGTPVTFQLKPWHRGEFEAIGIAVR
jgi:cold shock CspA family protein